MICLSWINFFRGFNLTNFEKLKKSLKTNIPKPKDTKPYTKDADLLKIDKWSLFLSQTNIFLMIRF